MSALVTGATGNVGGALVQILAADGTPVRALSRDQSATYADGVEAIHGDLNEPATFAAALAGVDAMFLLSGYANLPETLAVARDAGVRHVVLLSSSSVDAEATDNAIAAYNIASESDIRSSGLTWTFLQPNQFMTNTLQWRPQLAESDVIKLPYADVPLSVIDPYDIAAVAARALADEQHAGRTYRLSGPQSLLPGERLAVLGRALGRDLTMSALSDAEARAELGRSMPESYADAIHRFYTEGIIDETTVRTTVDEILGRPPHTFEQWVVEHARDFE